MEELKNKTAVITGAAHGIGRSFAIAMAKEGMKLSISDINLDALEEVKEEVENLGCDVIASKCDVSIYEDFENLAREVHSKFGKVDLLLNNAGISLLAPLEEFELEDWEKVLNINLWSIIHSLKAFLPKMLESKSGHIVNVASMAGIVGSTESLPYIASKFAVIGISEALYVQLWNKGIDVSVIVPSYIKTNIMKTTEIKFSAKEVANISSDKQDEIRQMIRQEFLSSSSSPDRVVKKYMQGIKKKQLYIFDSKMSLTIMTTKGSNPEQYEELLRSQIGKHEDSLRKVYSEVGLNYNDFR